MKCPVCVEVDLKIAERQGVEIDYCPRCRGVWLDRGELEKIIDRAAAYQMPSPAPTVTDAQKRKNDYFDDQDFDERYERRDRYDDRREPRYDDRDRDDRDYDRRDYDKRRRKKSFLDDIFDIFD